MHPRGPLHLLLVDDQADNLFVLQALLQAYLPDIVLHRALNAEQAQQIADVQPIDCALIDVQMPDVDGVTLCRQLKSRPASREIAIIILTSHHTTTELRVRGLEAGADDFIQRPFDNEEFIARVKVLLRTKRAEDQLRTLNNELEARVQERTARLAASEQRLRAFMDAVGDGLLLLDAELKLVDCNRAFAQLAGQPVAALRGKNLRQLTHDPHQDQRHQAYRQVLATGESVHFNELHLDGDQGEKVLNIHAFKVGEGLGITISDITEPSRTRQALANSAAHWQATFDALPECVMVLSDSHEILAINQAGCALVGGSPEELVGRRCYQVMHRTEAPIPECPCTRICVDHQPADTEIVQDGRHLQLSASAVVTKDGVSNSFVHIIRDVTEQVQQEHDTAALLEQLNQAQRMEAVGLLAGGVAHDFNNILTVINNHSTLAAEELNEGDPLHEDLLIILDAGERAATLTRQLLAFSRKQVLAPKLLDINQAIHDLLPMLRRLLGEDIEIVFQPQEPLGATRADPAQLDQVLINLAVNARDAMPTGGRLQLRTADVTLEAESVEARFASGPGDYVEIEVSDDGHGMEKHVAEHVFDPFFTTKEEGHGTGLGLSTVYGIVKQSGGSIFVDSVPGQGTRLRVYLPRVEAPAHAQPAPTPTSPSQGHETVLLVEDEPAVRRLSERILRRAGYTVLAAANGGEALLLCEQHPEVDLLLTDVVMPLMSGKQLADRLQRLHRGLRVLYMSGYTDDAILRHGVEEQSLDFIGKPFDVPDLLHKVREVLDREA